MSDQDAEARSKMAALAASMPPYPDRFYAAARFAAIPGTVEVAPGSENTTPYSDLTCLALYSLYQQAAHGPCAQPKPWAWNIVELAKWQSWKELGNMHRMEAMRLFVRALEDEDPDWWSKAQELEAQAAEEEEAKTGLKTPRSPLKSPFKSPLGTPGSGIPGVPLTPKLSLNGGADVGASPLPPLVTSLASQLVDACETENTWAVVTTSGRRPAARYQHASIVMSDKMIVVGGNTGRFVSDIQALDLSTLTWSKLEFTSTDSGNGGGSGNGALPACAGHALAALDDRTVLIVGGHNKAGTNTSEKMGIIALDLETYAWRLLKTKGALPGSRGGHSASKVGNVLWVFGGEDRKRHLLNDVYSLDLTTLVWTQLETNGTPPSPRSDHCAMIYNERYLTVFGGGSHSFCYNDIHVLDLETGEWTGAGAFGAVPSPRAGHAGVTVGSAWFVVGGGDNKCGLCDTMMLDLDTLTWTTVTTAQERTPISSEGLSVVPVESPKGTLLIAFGGYNGKYSNDVLVLRPHPDLVQGSHTPQVNLSGKEEFGGSTIDLSATGMPGSSKREGGLEEGKETERGEVGDQKSERKETKGEREGRDDSGVPSTSDKRPTTPKADTPTNAIAPSSEKAASAAGVPEPAVPVQSAPAQTQSNTPKSVSVSEGGGVRGHGQIGEDPSLVEELQAQLEDAQAAVARMEKVVLNARATANHTAAEARADAWQAIGQAHKEVEEMREKVAQALAAKQAAEDELAEGMTRVVAAQAAAASAQAEAARLRKDLGESRGRVQELQAELARIGSDSELAKVRKDFGVCKQALAEAEQEVQSVRALLSAEQARSFKLEVEVAELRQRLSEMSDLQAELNLLRKQKEASEDAAVAAQEKKTRGWFG